MSNYLSRLKQLDTEKHSQQIPDTEPAKPPKGAFAGSGGMGLGHTEKNNALTKGGAPSSSIDILKRLEEAPQTNVEIKAERRSTNCSQCKFLRRPGTAQACGERTDLPIMWGLLHHLPADYGLTCPRWVFKSLGFKS